MDVQPTVPTRDDAGNDGIVSPDGLSFTPDPTFARISGAPALVRRCALCAAVAFR